MASRGEAGFAGRLRSAAHGIADLLGVRPDFGIVGLSGDRRSHAGDHFGCRPLRLEQDPAKGIVNDRIIRRQLIGPARKGDGAGRVVQVQPRQGRIVEQNDVGIVRIGLDGAAINPIGFGPIGLRDGRVGRAQLVDKGLGGRAARNRCW